MHRCSVQLSMKRRSAMRKLNLGIIALLGVAVIVMGAYIAGFMSSEDTQQEVKKQASTGLAQVTMVEPEAADEADEDTDAIETPATAVESQGTTENQDEEVAVSFTAEETQSRYNALRSKLENVIASGCTAADSLLSDAVENLSATSIGRFSVSNVLSAEHWLANGKLAEANELMNYAAGEINVASNACEGVATVVEAQNSDDMMMEDEDDSLTSVDVVADVSSDCNSNDEDLMECDYSEE